MPNSENPKAWGRVVRRVMRFDIWICVSNVMPSILLRHV